MHDFNTVSPLLQHTPTWVWGVAAGLFFIGGSQLLPREVSARRALLLPVLLSGWSLYGMASGFGVAGLMAWLIAAAATAASGWARADLGQARYDARRGRFALAGSAWPLALLMSVFVLKFAAGALLSVQPALAHQPAVALALGAAGGAISGLFLGRAHALWQRVQSQPAAAPA